MTAIPMARRGAAAEVASAVAVTAIAVAMMTPTIAATADLNTDALRSGGRRRRRGVKECCGSN